MASPNSYFKIATELDAVKARAFLFLMSEEVVNITTPLASQLFDMVGDMTEKEANEAISSLEAIND